MPGISRWSGLASVACSLMVRVSAPTCGSIVVSLAGKRDETVDGRLYLETGQTNVLQCAVVEIVKACHGGPTAKIARGPLASGAEQPKKCAGPLRDSRQDDRGKYGRHVQSPMLRALSSMLRGKAVIPAQVGNRPVRGKMAAKPSVLDTISLAS